jgi:hypothetical protein
MGRRTLLVLIGVTAILTLIWIMTPTEDVANDSRLLFPGLKGDLNSIVSVRITAGGNQPVVTLTRGEQQWTVEEKYGYTANLGKIRQNLRALGDATIVENKTSSPEFYGRLGIQDLSHADATGHLVEIDRTGDDGSETIGVIVGDTGVRGETAYARLPGDEQGLLISADLDLGEDSTDWLARDLIDIASSDIRSITINHPDGEIVRIEKSSESEPNYSVLDIPAGREVAYATIANPVAGLLTKLEIDDVSPADSIEKSDSLPTIARFETFDGLIVEAAVYTIDDKKLVTFSASADEPLTEQADEINARVATWVYSLPSFKSEQLGKRLSDFLKADGE